VVAKVEHHAGDLFTRVGFIVTNRTLPNRAVVRFYNKRGTAQQWIKEGKRAVKMTRLSCHRFRSNDVRLWLSVIAYNPGNLWCRLVLPKRIGQWSLTSLQQRLVRTGGRLVKHTRYYWLLLAESHPTRRRFGAMVGRIESVPLPAGYASGRRIGFQRGESQGGRVSETRVARGVVAVFGVLARGTNGTFSGPRKHRALQTQPTVQHSTAQLHSAALKCMLSGGPDSIIEIPGKTIQGTRRSHLFTSGAALIVALTVTITCPLSAQNVRTAPAKGPLRVHPTNPRYFTDGSGRAVYLTAAHTWANLQEIALTDPPAVFDYDRYLKFLIDHNHNFIRLWRWEIPKEYEKDGIIRYCAPHPWPRTGPGVAWDGKPKFDLSRFDELYFERLRSRVEAASKVGIYVSIMLFEGWALQFSNWSGHPFNLANNINGINGDKDDDGKGIEAQAWPLPDGLENVEKAYVRKVIDTVNDLDNVLYEISNEGGPYSTDWQYETIDFVHSYERTKPKQHPVGMTFQYSRGSNSTLFHSPADWISPILSAVPARIITWTTLPQRTAAR
jgi:hypothetical protein